MQGSPDPSIQMGAPFQDGMILQRDMKVPVWGWSAPGDTITVEFAGQKVTAKAGEDGKWMLMLEPLKASAEPTEMVVSSSISSLASHISNILVGEVWFCSGQSNMAWKMGDLGKHYDKEIKEADYPRLRLFNVPKDMFATTPQSRVEGAWHICTPETVKSFSAVAFFFGSKLHDKLQMPIGLVESSRGGSAIAGWISEPVLRHGFPEFTAHLDTYRGITEKTGGVFDHRRKSKLHGITQTAPSVLYNARVHPFVPYAIRGVIWYQGETDVGIPERYRQLFPALIRQWRKSWGQGDFPFYYVQIAPCGYEGQSVSAAYLREAQMMTMSEPYTGMAVAMDVGHPKNLHPFEKKPLGERLALWALAKDYGHKDLVYSGPLYKTFTVEGGRIRLHFDHVGGGLASRDGEPLCHFAVAGEDKHFVPATAVIDGDTILVSSPEIAGPVAARFAFGSADIPNLMNREGLPASSFRTDDDPVPE